MTRTILFVLASSVVALSSCSDSSPRSGPALTFAELAGTWRRSARDFVEINAHGKGTFAVRPSPSESHIDELDLQLKGDSAYSEVEGRKYRVYLKNKQTLMLEFPDGRAFGFEKQKN
jgi:hypothetical protein